MTDGREITEAYRAGQENMQSRAAVLATAHIGAATRDRQSRKGMRLGDLSEDARLEIAAEERGENIAAEQIAKAIRGLRIADD